MKTTIIDLPYGGTKAAFNLNDLKSYFKSKKLKYMVIGQAKASYDKHPKPESLDIWLRDQESVKKQYKNTCQAVNSVVNKIISSDDFALGLRKCKYSNRLCKSIVLV
jgi:hypothetical protein